jgi:hypothetical protein
MDSSILYIEWEIVSINYDFHDLKEHPIIFDRSYMIE